MSYKSCRSEPRESRRERRAGSVIVLMTLSLVVMVGFCAFAADLGLLFYTKTRLQIACDAAALAGAQEMPANANKAFTTALKSSQQNGVASPEITFPTAQQVRVNASQKIDFMFAPVLGIKSNTVVATTIAGRSFGLKGIPEVVPLAITPAAYTANLGGASFMLRLVRNNKDAFTNEHVLALDFRVDSSGKSGGLFEEDLINGYPNTIFIGDNYNALTASEVSQAASLVNAMQTRFSAAAAAAYYDTGTNYTFPNYPAQSRRIITIVVSDEKPANNNNPVVPIRYFAPIYVEEVWQTTGVVKETVLKLRILPGRSYNSGDPRVVVGDANTPNTGLTVVKMGE